MTAFEQGKRAREKGKPLDANPHDADHAAHEEWSAGWNAMSEAIWSAHRRPKPAPDAHLGAEGGE